MSDGYGPSQFVGIRHPSGNGASHGHRLLHGYFKELPAKIASFAATSRAPCAAPDMHICELAILH